MRRLVLVVGLLSGCAAAPPARPVCSGARLIDLKAAEDAREYRRDGVAFAIPGVVLVTAGLLTGVADAQLLEEPAWLRGATIGLLTAGVASSVVAFTFDVLAQQARERATRQCVQISDATHR